MGTPLEALTAQAIACASVPLGQAHSLVLAVDLAGGFVKLGSFVKLGILCRDVEPHVQGHAWPRAHRKDAHQSY